MSDVLDNFVDLFKWPIACLALWSLPAFFQSLDYFNFRNTMFICLFGGFFTYFVAQLSMDTAAKTSMQIIAHELTHSFFALLTLHKVKHIRVEADNSGGSMGFSGKGNWLIVIAPYFFPLFCMVFMIIETIYLKITADGANWIIYVLFGYFIGYHIDTVTSQIHDKQTDLKLVGYPFCFAFLPGANLWVIGCLLAYNSRSWEGIMVYQKLLWKLDVQNFHYLINLITDF